MGKSVWERTVDLTIAVGERVLAPVERFIGRRSLVGEATFFENDRFPWIAELETNWTTIREELEHVLEDREALPNFQDISKDQIEITDDDATVPLLVRYAGVDPARVRVIPLGIDVPDPLPAPLVRPRPYLLYAGNHRPHKDLATLVAAWASLPAGDAVDLVLTGDDESSLRGVRHPRGELAFVGDWGGRFAARAPELRLLS